jgi:hypothetical protein
MEKVGHVGSGNIRSISAFHGLIVYMYFKDNNQHIRMATCWRAASLPQR